MEEIVIFPDSELDGTNVLVFLQISILNLVMAWLVYAHLKSATMLEAEVLVVADSPFSFDIDDPDDLHHVL
ncbi:MAG: hypothetical protein Ct9H90mP11_04600 [Acidimicrobiales bacterium]|nr:MAG: hypothetical protein Ct9H90mP11_04600 [Acidimicrobiales bacterium]